MGRATGPTFVVAFRRRRKGLTNYKKRLALLKSGLPRMVVRKTGKNVIVQFLSFAPEGDRTIAAANSASLKKFKWPSRSNAPTAYLTALLAGKEALKKGVTDFVLDIGLGTPSKGSLYFAALEGALHAGLRTNYEKEKIVEDSVCGMHIARYAQKLKQENPVEYNKRFSDYLKMNIDPEKLPELFESVKQQIGEGTIEK